MTRERGQVQAWLVDDGMGFDRPDGGSLVRWMTRTGPCPKLKPSVHTPTPPAVRTCLAALERTCGEGKQSAGP